jgi:vacuolar-type H+-ATPase subunit H
LEDVINDGRRVPFSDRLLVDEEACRQIIDQMRVSVPDIVKQAERTLGERDRIIAQANEEASRIVQMAREQATEMVENHELVEAAQRQANELLARAENEAIGMRAEADDYAVNALRALASQLEKIHQEVDNGIQSLVASRQARR